MKEREEALECALSLPGVYSDTPFRDPNWIVVRHRGSRRIFLWTYERQGNIWINVKCRADWSHVLCASFESVVPAYHQNKRHRVSVILDGKMKDEDIRWLIEESYRLTENQSKSGGFHMSKVYRIGRLPEGVGRCELGGVFAPEALEAPYAALEEARLDEFPWDENGYRPDTRARVGWNEQGLHVLMYSHEPAIRAVETRTGGDVYLDSCMELFLMPKEGNPLYFNCEVSPRPTVHLGIGTQRHGRTVYRELPEGMNVVSSEHAGGWWAVSYTIPAWFLKEVFGLTMAGGLSMRGNFYKCADGTPAPHYGMFKGYFDVPAPDYHRPERFTDFVTA